MAQTLLRQVAEAGAPGDLQFAGIHREFAGQHAQHGGLAGAVLTAQTDAVSGPNMPVDAGKNPSLPKILGNIS